MEVDFDSRVKEHMAKYKQSVLKITEAGIWKRNKRPYKHILPEESSSQYFGTLPGVLFQCAPGKDPIPQRFPSSYFFSGYVH